VKGQQLNVLMNVEEQSTEAVSPSTHTEHAPNNNKQSEQHVPTISLVQAGSSSLDLEVGGLPVRARIDSGAEITILSSIKYAQLKKKPAKVKDITMRLADNDSSIKGFIIKPISIRLGNQTFKERVYVAPIQDEMLLGHDLLHHLGALLDLQTDCLLINNESIPLITTFRQGNPRVARVTIAKRAVIPPKSVLRVKCRMTANLDTYYIEPAANLKLAVPRIVRAKNEAPLVCFVNSSESFHTLKKGKIVGNAMVIQEVLESAGSEASFASKWEGSNGRAVSPAEDREVNFHSLRKGMSDERVVNPMVERVVNPMDERVVNPTRAPDERVVNPTRSPEERVVNPPEQTGDEVPQHLKQMYESSKEKLTADEAKLLAKLLRDFEDVFAKDEFDLGNFTALEHSIDTGDAKPVKQGIRRTPACFVGEEEAHLKKMLEAGVIEESTSDWASAPVLIRKKDGNVRWCIDYRALNNVTVKDTFPLPLVEDCMDTLSGNIWFSKLDANSAYWQVKVKKEDRKKTAFITKYGLFEHVRMGFGLCNAVSTFSRVMSLILRGMTWKIVLAFLDDVLVMGKDMNDHLENLTDVLGRFRKYGLKLKPKKCLFFQQEVEFLGRIVNSSQLLMSPKDTKAVREWPVPLCSKDVERFLGFANYHRSFVKDFAKLASPLYELTGKNAFKWGDEQQVAFESLRQVLVEPPVLTLPNGEDPFILDTDASDLGIGGVLSQVQDDIPRVVAYGSFSLTPEQKRYCTTRKELLSIVRFTRQYKYYLLGRIFTVRTDHSSLTWLLKFKDPQGQLARWIEELSQYTMIVKFRPGAKHTNVDPLSRHPDDLTPCPNYVSEIKPEDLPCGGCHYCRRVDEQWGTFFREIDDTVGLADLGSKPVQRGATAAVRRPRIVGLEAEPCLAPIFPGKLPEPGPTGKREEGDGRLAGLLTPKTSESSQSDISDSSDEETESSWESAAQFDVVIHQGDPEIVVVNDVRVRQESTPGNPCCWGFTFHELATAQGRDESLDIILNWMKNQERPAEGVLFSASPEVKTFWLNKEQFQLIDDVLFRQKKETFELELVVPAGLQHQVIEWHHDIPSSGHQGIARTKAKLKEKFYWYSLARDVEAFILSCDVCGRNKKNKKYGKVPLTAYQAGAPMERVHIDFIGPLPKTARGCEHCLMMVDQFTKWVECIPLPSQKAEVTAKAAIDVFFSRFGYPFQLFSDQGRNFESRLFEEVCKALQIHKTRTTPYRPSANGQVERFNRTLMDAVRCFLGKSQDKWDLHVQQIAGALRASVNRSTGYTPNMLMLGREVNIPAQLMFPNVQTSYPEYGEFVKDLTEGLKKSHESARKKLKTTTRRMKRDYDLRILLRPYEQGDVVYLLDSAVAKGKSRKLCSPWKGPAVITKKISSYLYQVKLQNAVLVMNHDRLMPCNARRLPQWITRLKNQEQSGGTGDVPIAADDADTLYCLCRRPAGGRFMIQCDYCSDWYHGSCVDVSASDALAIDKYRCINCRS